MDVCAPNLAHDLILLAVTTEFGRLFHVITCDKFFGERLSGVDSVAGRQIQLPLTRVVLPCSL